MRALSQSWVSNTPARDAGSHSSPRYAGAAGLDLNAVLNRRRTHHVSLPSIIRVICSSTPSYITALIVADPGIMVEAQTLSPLCSVP